MSKRLFGMSLFYNPSDVLTDKEINVLKSISKGVNSLDKLVNNLGYNRRTLYSIVRRFCSIGILSSFSDITDMRMKLYSVTSKGVDLVGNI